MRYGTDAPLTKAMVDDATDGFSPCPGPVVDILKTWVTPTQKGGTLLDNCAGDGAAACSLAQAWGLRPILVEPHPIRHALCLQHDKGALCAPAQCVSGRGPTVWFFNPPYDLADETGSMERHLLSASIDRVPEEMTLCIWLLPQRMLDDAFLPHLLEQHLEEVRTYRLPEAWEDFHQIAILGYWVDRTGKTIQELCPTPTTFFLQDSPRLKFADRPYSLKSVGYNFAITTETDGFVARH